MKYEMKLLNFNQDEREKLFDQISGYINESRYTDAIETCIGLGKLIKENDNSLIHGVYLILLGRLYIETHENIKSESALQKGLDILSTIDLEALGTSKLRYYYRLLGHGIIQEPIHGYVEPKFGKLICGLGYYYLGILYNLNGEHVKSESALQQGSDIAENIAGENSFEYALYSDALGVACIALSKYTRSKYLFFKSLKISETNKVKDKIMYTSTLLSSLLHLSQIYDLVDQSSSARLYLGLLMSYINDEKSHKIFIEKHKKIYAKLLIELGYFQSVTINEDHISNYSSLEAYFPSAHTSIKKGLDILHEAHGENLFQEGLDLLRDTHGEESLDYALALNRQATSYLKNSNFINAESALQKALDIVKRIAGENSFECGIILINYGRLYLHIRNYTKAEYAVQKGLDIIVKLGGENTMIYSSLLQELVNVYILYGRTEEALVQMQKIATIENYLLTEILPSSSHSERIEFLERVNLTFHSFMSNILHHFKASPHAMRFALSLILSYKSLSIDLTIAERQAINNYDYSAQSQQYVDLLNQINRDISRGSLHLSLSLSHATSKNCADIKDIKRFRNHLFYLHYYKNQLEAHISNRMPQDYYKQTIKIIDATDISNSIGKDFALIEFVKLYDSNVHRWKYLALGLVGGKLDSIKIADLGEADKIDKMIFSFLSHITGSDTNNYGNCHPANSRNLIPILTQVDDKNDANDDNGQNLRSAVFDPILFAIGECKTLIISPDGELNRIPFEVLPTRTGHMRLIDDYQISYVNSGRDLLRPRTSSNGIASEALVIADPDFDLGKSFSPEFDQDHYSAVHFERLQSTHLEGEIISDLLGVTALMGEKALEFNIKRQKSPYILHIATHGFFLSNESQKFTNMDISELRSDRIGGLNVFNLKDPMLRSGLALAGANTWLDLGWKRLPYEAEDGILTAQDVEDLDLSNSELVVLSACETGIGEVMLSEAIFGLRRSFTTAGAHTLIMSLWKIPDKQTTELMVEFYERLLAGNSKNESLREAQLTIKEKYPDPLYWGAFVCYGDTGPLLSARKSDNVFPILNHSVEVNVEKPKKEEVLDIVQGAISFVRMTNVLASAFGKDLENTTIITTNRRIIGIKTETYYKTIGIPKSWEFDSAKTEPLKERLQHMLEEKKWLESGFEISLDDISGIEMKLLKTHDGILRIKSKSGVSYKVRTPVGDTEDFEKLYNAMNNILPELLVVKRNCWTF